MYPIKATWINGRIMPAEPVDWPEGSELIVEPVATPGKIGLDESEWRDDAEALFERPGLAIGVVSQHLQLPVVT